MESLLDLLFYAALLAIADALLNDQGGGKRGRQWVAHRA